MEKKKRNNECRGRKSKRLKRKLKTKTNNKIDAHE